MQKLRQLITLSLLTASETIRQPVCLLLTAICIMLTIAVPLITAHNFGEGGRLARDSGLAFHLMFGLFISGYASCATLDRERKAGTTASILSKPVTRNTFFLAKFFGIISVIILFSICAATATLLAERIAIQFSTENGFLIDYRTAITVLLCIIPAYGIGAWRNFKNNCSFQSTTFLTLPVLMLIITATCGLFARNGEWHPYHPHLQWQIVVASLIITVGLTMLAAIALAIAVRFSLVPTIFICFALLVLGLVSDYVFGQFADRSWIASLLYSLTPNWQNFWTADAIANGGTIPLLYIVRTTLYSLLYTSGILCLGATAFKHSEVS
jgi:hypothetical protein